MVKALTHNKQSGFGLIELMIAIALSSLMLLGVLQIFEANKRTGNLTSGFARVQESGRMAVEMLVRDVRMADSWGCVGVGSIDITDHLDPSDTDYQPYMSWKNAAGVEGSNDAIAGTTIGTISVKPNTDVLTMRGAKPMHNAHVVFPYMTPNAAVVHVNKGADIPEGTIVLITDCTGADLFSNKHPNTSGSGSLLHNTGNITAPGAVDNDFKDLSHTYGANAQILIPFVKTYFVGRENADDPWSLFRQENNKVFELVRDVTDLQILYGEDTGDDSSADLFSDAASVTDMGKVVSIRATIVTESDSAANGGSPLAKTYAVTTNIRNRSL